MQESLCRSLMHSLSGGTQVLEVVQQTLDLIDHHMNGVMLSAGLIALFTLPRSVGRRQIAEGLRERAVNVVIGSIVAVFAFLCTALASSFAALVWRDGLIGLVLPGWRGEGVGGLLISVVAYGSCGTSFNTGSTALSTYRRPCGRRTASITATTGSIRRPRCAGACSSFSLRSCSSCFRP